MGKATEKKMSVAGTIIHWIFMLILILVIVACFAFFAVMIGMSGKKLTIDDIKALAASKPAPSSEHLSFSKDGDMTLTLDKSDIWYFLDRELDPDWQENISRIAGKADARFSGCGLNITDDGIVVDAEFYRGIIRIAFSVICDVRLEGSSICVTPSKIRVLSFDFPAESFISLVNNGEQYTFRYTPEYTFLKRIDSFELGDDKISFTGPVDTSFIHSCAADEETLLTMGFALEDGKYIAPAVASYSGDACVCFADFMDALVSDSSVFTELLEQFFTVSRGDVIGLEAKNHGLVCRWYPEFKPEGYVSKYSALQESISRAEEHMSRATEKLAAEYAEKKLTVYGWQLFHEKQAFTPKHFFGISYDLYIQTMDLDNMKFCFYQADGFNPGELPKLGENVDDTASLSDTAAEMDLVYAPGMLLKGKDGCTYALVYSGNEKGFELVPVDRDLFHTLMGDNKIAVLDLREAHVPTGFEALPDAA